MILAKLNSLLVESGDDNTDVEGTEEEAEDQDVEDHGENPEGRVISDGLLVLGN